MFECTLGIQIDHKRTMGSSSSRLAVAISPPRITRTNVLESGKNLNDTTSDGFVEEDHGFAAK